MNSFLTQRSQAIDVLRGLTLALMIMVNRSFEEGRSYTQLLHADWNGLTLTDLVFPTFLFVVGTALSFTLPRYQSMGSAAVLRKVLWRTAIIFLCGYLLYWFPFFAMDAQGHLTLLPVSHTRILGVLQRIALGYGLAALILHFGGRRVALVFAVAALAGYWWILSYFGDLTMAGNAATRLDRLLLGEAHMYHGEGMAFDPEGVLGTLPAVVNVIAGYFAGRYLQENARSAGLLLRMAALGLLSIALAGVWNGVLPINKKIWTSSYVLCAIGIDLCVLALLVHVIDVRGARRWTYFFEVFGRNTIAIYLMSEICASAFWLVQVGGQDLFDWLYARGFQSWAGDKNGSLLFSLAYMLFFWCIAYAMDRRRLYIKV